MQLSNNLKLGLSNFAQLIQYKRKWLFQQCIKYDFDILLLSTGNRAGKTGTIAYQYVLRILGFHPIARKNITFFRCSNNHEISPIKKKNQSYCSCGKKWELVRRNSRVIRFASQNLPGQSSGKNKITAQSEIRNTQYPEFMKWLPRFLLKKDITFRNPAQTICDPFGYDDIVVEYISYNQAVQAGGGVSRLSVWLDESPNIDFYEEQLPRLIGDDGDLIISYTPADRTSWIFDEIFEKGDIYLRSKSVIDYYKQYQNKDYLPTQQKGKSQDIVIIQAATDDNPIMLKDTIDKKFESIDDPDTIAIRRYGIFKQSSGQIFKTFNYPIHFLSAMQSKDLFPNGIPLSWKHGRGIDWHPQTDLACGFISLSPTDEAFIWGEKSIPPDNFSIDEVAEIVSNMSQDYKFCVSLIDPLSVAHKTVINGKSITVKDQLNYSLRNYGLSGSPFFSWDTKGERGRDEIRKRLKNSIKVGEPFNNKIVDNYGCVSYLPTIWILNNCPQAAKSMASWRWKEWASPKDAIIKGEKNSPEQKYSHFNMVWEALFKHSSFRLGLGEIYKLRSYNRFRR